MTNSQWMGKQIDSLSQKELESAVSVVRSTAEKYNNKRAEIEKYRKDPNHRFNKMFADGKMPKINPLFTKLQDDLESELKRRTGVK